MLSQYEKEKVLHLTVIKDNAIAPTDLNLATIEAQTHITELAMLSVDICKDGLIPVVVDYFDVLYLGKCRAQMCTSV
jgi:hypothetical protein